MKRKDPEKILVTGGGGFLGGAIVKQLRERGEKVTSFSRKSYPELEEMGAEQVQGDIRDRKKVTEACRDMEVVFHVAAKPGVWGRFKDFYRTNAIGTQNVIAACIENKVSRLIHTSSPSVIFTDTDMEGVNESVPYPHHYDAHYPKTKALAEQEVVKASRKDLLSIILRPHLIWGPGDNHLVPRIIERAKQLRKVGHGKNLVDTIYIDNAAEAHILASDKLKERPQLSGGIYFISQDEPVLLWDMVDSILAAAGMGPVTKSVPKYLAWLIGAFLEMGHTLFRIESEPKMTRFVARELATAHWFDISAAKKDLGYVPRVSISEGLKRLEKWLKDINPEVDHKNTSSHPTV